MTNSVIVAVAGCITVIAACLIEGSAFPLLGLFIVLFMMEAVS